MFYTYVIRSLKDGNLYTGFASDLRKRLLKYNNGQVKSTKNRRPFKLIYYEACENKTDALHREIYLKTSWGKKYIKSRLKNYFNGMILKSHS
jgi:putative endonuclease